MKRTTRVRTLGAVSHWPSQIIKSVVKDRPHPVGEEESWLHRILDAYPNGSINVLDRDLRYVLTGGKGLGEVGLSRELLVGNTLAQLFRPEEVDMVFGAYDRAFAGESAVCLLHFANNTYEIQAEPLDEEGEPVRHILAVTRKLRRDEVPAPPNVYDLSPRELEVLGFMALGYADKQIAAALGSRVYTVNKQVSSILAKLDARSRTEASVRAIREGLVEPERLRPAS